MSPDEIRQRFPAAIEQPSRGRAVLRLLREALIVCLAFVGGAGAFLFAIDRDPLRWQDWAGAAAAGAVAALAKMFPTAAGGGRG